MAKSPPDGYTLLMGTVGTQAINPALYPKMPYDAVKDFMPITLVAGVPNVLVINPAKAAAYRITDVSRLIAYAQGATPASSTWPRAATAPRSISPASCSSR